MTAPSPARSGNSPIAELQREVVALAAVLQEPRHRQGRPRHHLHADGAGSGRSPCSPARGSARCIRSCSAASPSHELATRIDDAKPKLIISASCGLEPGRVVAYKPLLDSAIAMSQAQARRLPHPAARAAALRTRGQAATSTMPTPLPASGPRAPMSTAFRSLATDPLYILYTSGTTGQPKGIVRDNGGHMVALEMVDGERIRRQAGRGVLGGLRRRLGGRPFLYRLRAAAAWLHDDPLRGQAGRHARCRHLLARHRRARRRRAVHRADRFPRHQAARTRTATFVPKYDLSTIPHAVPRRRARRPGHHQMGRAEAERAGHRPLVADRDRLADDAATRPASACCR